MKLIDQLHAELRRKWIEHTKADLSHLARFVTQLIPRTSRGYHNRFSVPSESREGISYTVSQQNRNRRWCCSCSHWIWRQNAKGLECKHIVAVRLFLADKAPMRIVVTSTVVQRIHAEIEEIRRQGGLK